MESLLRLCSSLLLVMPLLLFADFHFAVSADPPQFSPTPAPESGGSNTPSPESGAPAPGPSTDFNYPLSPPPSDAVPTSPPPTPTPAPAPSPSPLPSDASDISQGSSSGEELKGGQKAGIAIGVINGACVVGLFGVIYKKRQDNIRHSQYGYVVRRELL